MRWYLLPLVLAAAAACAEPAGSIAPTPVDAVPERTDDARALAEDFAPDGVHRVSPVLEAPLGATRVGALATLRASGPAPRLWARATPGGAWVPMAAGWAEGDQVVLQADLGTVARAVELRIAEADAPRVALLTWSAVVPQPAPPPAPVGRRRDALRSELARLGVQDRAAWSARATRCTSPNTAKYRMAIHHTVSPASGDPASRLRGIQAFHMDTRGWCDIGYHFLVSLDGRLWEGRPLELLGAHVGGHNTGNIGISFIGCFHPSGCASFPPNAPPDVMVDAAADLVAELAALYAIPRDATTILGHRDHTGASTACPGDFLHDRLPEIRAGASGREPAYGAAFVRQSFPLARDPFELGPGEEVRGFFELRNVGTEAWRPGETFLATTLPRDGPSALAGPDWVSPSRPATVDRVVAPGEAGTFAFTVRAPGAPGDYPQFLNVLQEGVAWVSDEGQGGPADDWFQVRVTVVEPGGGAPDAGVAPPPPHTGGPPAADAGTGQRPDAGPGGAVVAPRLLGDGPRGAAVTVVGGCAAGAVPGAGGGAWALAVPLVWAARRRRRGHGGPPAGSGQSRRTR